MPGRLMVGQQTLNLFIGVRVPAGQQDCTPTEELLSDLIYLILNWLSIMNKIIDYSNCPWDKNNEFTEGRLFQTDFWTVEINYKKHIPLSYILNPPQWTTIISDHKEITLMRNELISFLF